MKLRLLIPAALFCLAGAGLPAQAESFGEGVLSWSAASDGSWSWKHILFIALTVISFGLVVFLAVGLPTIRQAMREGKSKARADTLGRRMCRSLKRRTFRREMGRQDVSAKKRDSN